MISLVRPQPCDIRRFLDDQLTGSFSYREVGATNGELPDGYFINHVRRFLGRGLACFQAARDSLHRWEQLQLGWVDCWSRETPVMVGEPIAILGRAFGLWSLNACRIAYVFDEDVATQRFGYAVGTLAQHLASGEERFLVEMNEQEDVWLDILSFSKPNTVLAQLGAPLMRRCQRRFARAATLRVARSVADVTISPDDALLMQGVPAGIARDAV